MSNEESVAGINVRELLEEKQRLHKMHRVYEEAYQFQEKRIQQLEEENDRLKTLNKALKVQKDPEQHLIPWDKAKQDLYIQELEEALRQTEKQRDDFFYWAEELAAHGFNCTYGHEGPNKFIPVAREYWSEMQDDIAALSPSEAPEKEGEDGKSNR